jgi:hypothetical protein
MKEILLKLFGPPPYESDSFSWFMVKYFLVSIVAWVVIFGATWGIVWLYVAVTS